MTNYPLVQRALATCFNAEDGLSEDVSRRLLSRMFDEQARALFTAELNAALADPDVSWRSMLCNPDDEVMDFDDEEQARDFAVKNLLTAIAPKQLS